MKINISEATPLQLDWLVAKCEGYFDSILNIKTSVIYVLIEELNYSTDWAQGGPIIEREQITLTCDDKKLWWAERHIYDNGTQAYLTSFHKAVLGIGPTPLIAAMRCLVASKLGEEVEVPEELK